MSVFRQGAWLKAALAHAGLSQSELARQLTKRLKRTIDRATVGTLVHEARHLRADELIAAAEITGYPLPSITVKKAPTT